jgi:hypothetical protein
MQLPVWYHDRDLLSATPEPLLDSVSIIILLLLRRVKGLFIRLPNAHKASLLI